MDGLEPGLSTEATSAIGRFISNFALLERYIRDTVIDFPGMSAWAGEIIISQLSFSALLKSYAAVIKEYTPPDGRHDRAIAFLKRVDGITSHRNRVVHAFWQVSGPRNEDLHAQKTTVSRIKGLTIDATLYSIKELEELSDEIASLTAEAADIYGDLNRSSAVEPDPMTE